MKKLLNWVDRPETHQKIVGGYEGSYALGVTSDPPAFLLRVQPKDVSQFPRSVTLHGVDVPVIVRGSFEQPEPLEEFLSSQSVLALTSGCSQGGIEG